MPVTRLDSVASLTMRPVTIANTTTRPSATKPTSVCVSSRPDEAISNCTGRYSISPSNAPVPNTAASVWRRREARRYSASISHTQAASSSGSPTRYRNQSAPVPPPKIASCSAPVAT